jgi:hypothetical protein
MHGSVTILQGYSYAGVENSDTCYCGDLADAVNIVDPANAAPDSDCDSACPGVACGAQTCGGVLKISVYQTSK